MKFGTFEKRAAQAFEEIPERYRIGIDGLVVSREAMPHPDRPDVFTLGYCETEAYPSEWNSADTTRSVIVLYYGSFKSLARRDPDFDWDAEIHETVEHEVKHHLESLADRDELGDVDYAMDEGFKRTDGEAWDPWYFQHGERVGEGVYAVEDASFIEIEMRGGHFDELSQIEFSWQETTYAIDRPEQLGDVHYVWVEGVEDAPPSLEVVLVRRRSWWEDVKRLTGASRLIVLESTAPARIVTSDMET